MKSRLIAVILISLPITTVQPNIPAQPGMATSISYAVGAAPNAFITIKHKPAPNFEAEQLVPLRKAQADKVAADLETARVKAESDAKAAADAAAAQQAAESTPAPQTASRAVSGTCSDWLAAAGIPATSAVTTLINNESGCNPNAVNPSSGACGIGQALPCSKMGAVNPNGTSSLTPVQQLQWMQTYVIGRYGSWESALSFWNCVGLCQGVKKIATWY